VAGTGGSAEGVHRGCVAKAPENEVKVSTRAIPFSQQPVRRAKEVPAGHLPILGDIRPHSLFAADSRWLPTTPFIRPIVMPAHE
jgi:hypothetical protein